MNKVDNGLGQDINIMTTEKNNTKTDTIKHEEVEEAKNQQENIADTKPQKHIDLNEPENTNNKKPTSKSKDEEKPPVAPSPKMDNNKDNKKSSSDVDYESFESAEKESENVHSGSNSKANEDDKDNEEDKIIEEDNVEGLLDKDYVPCSNARAVTPNPRMRLENIKAGVRFEVPEAPEGKENKSPIDLSVEGSVTNRSMTYVSLSVSSDREDDLEIKYRVPSIPQADIPELSDSDDTSDDIDLNELL